MPTPDWPRPEDLPPLLARDGGPLPTAELTGLVEVLRHELPASLAPTLEEPHPPQPWRRAVLPAPLRAAFESLRQRCGDTVLDSWMAGLLRGWLSLGTGTARKLRWLVPATAVLGGDACAVLLGAHLRGENHDLRCRGDLGVDALIEIGTRGALLELAQLAKKYQTKTRGTYALQALRQIAAAQGLTPDQLQDRILPDGGLDERGERSFDYGPRQFAAALDDGLAAVLRAPDGRRLTNLPKPTARDDSARAEEARHAWKIAKLQMSQTARWLARRFEGAMISGESWAPEEFAAFFRRHPLARHVVRRVLWTIVHPVEPPGAHFRIAEDDTLADVADTPMREPVTPERIRAVHPLELDAPALVAWQQVFADYQIVGPFPQLDRPTFRVSPADRDRRILIEFLHRRIEAKALVFPLESRGWERDGYADGGMLTQHARTFAHAGIRACLDYAPGAYLGDLPASDVQELERLYFVPTGDCRDPARALPFGTVAPVVYSETMRDLHALVPAS